MSVNRNPVTDAADTNDALRPAPTHAIVPPATSPVPMYSHVVTPASATAATLVLRVVQYATLIFTLPLLILTMPQGKSYF